MSHVELIRTASAQLEFSTEPETWLDLYDHALATGDDMELVELVSRLEKFVPSSVSPSSVS